VYTHNWAQLVAFIAFVLLQVPLPLLVVQILAIDLGMDVWPSLALIMEPPESGLMKKSPRRTGTRLIDPAILLRGAYVGAIVSTVVLFWAFQTWMAGGWNFGQATVSDPTVYAKGTTIVMAGIMAGQLGNFFAARSSSESVFRLNPLRNRWLFPGILSQLAVLAAIIYVPFLQPLFGTAPLTLLDWAYLYCLAPSVVLIEELRKAFVRRLSRKRRDGKNFAAKAQ